MSFLKEKLKKVKFARKTVKTIKLIYKIWYVKTRVAINFFLHKKEISRIKKKVSEGSKIEVSFLVYDLGMWKSEPVYHLLAKNNKYSVKVIITPDVNAKNYESIHEVLIKNGVCVVEREKRQACLNASDLIFLNFPHPFVEECFYIKNISQKLIVYIPYFEQLFKTYDLDFNNYAVNLAWLNCQISPEHKLMAEKYAINRGENVVVTGYPVHDYYSKRDNFFESRKTIIIAPHHSIDSSSTLQTSMFMKYSDFLRKLPEMYPEVDFVFKPHPQLYRKLSVLWGQDKADEYYKSWEDGVNSKIERGSYYELFNRSTALIHDCTSFISEYSLLNKPCAHLNDELDDILNDYGKVGYRKHTLINKESEILDFIDSVLFDNGKRNKSKRCEFLDATNLVIKEVEKFIK